MTTLFLILIGLILVILLAAYGFSFRQERRSENRIFNAGTLPDHTALDGDYQGNKQAKSDWLGKRFDAETHSGINKFPNGERFPFHTSREKSLHGTPNVLRLNYNIDGNPLWLRAIVDEIVETEPGKYQGKVYIKIGPSVFTLTYFQLAN